MTALEISLGQSLACPDTRSTSLSEWLEISWFYPKDFQKKKLIDSPDRCLVVGQLLSYEFLKGLSFEQKLEEVSRELRLNTELAPDIYLGAKLLRWIDETPHWINSSSLNFKKLHGVEADEISLVLRNVPASSILSEQINKNSIVSDASLIKLSNVLKVFYSRRARQGTKLFLQAPRRVVSSLTQRLINSIPNASSEDSDGYFFHLIQSYLKNELEKRFKQSESYLHSRGSLGKLKMIHGNLQLSSICTRPLFKGGKSINITGREAEIYGDELEDIADLYVEFLICGKKDLAKKIKHLFVQKEEVSLFNLFLSLSCLKKISKQKNEKKSSLYLRQLLSTAFLALSCNSKPIVLLLNTSLEPFREIFKAYLDCEILGEEKKNYFLFDSCVREDQSFLKIKEKVKRLVAANENVILDSSQSSIMHIKELEKAVQASGAVCFYVEAAASDEKYISSPLVKDEALNGLTFNSWILNDAVSLKSKWEQVQDLLLHSLGF